MARVELPGSVKRNLHGILRLETPRLERSGREAFTCFESVFLFDICHALLIHE